MHPGSRPSRTHARVCPVAFGLKHNLDAFIFYRGPGGADEEFKNIRYWVNIMKTVDYVAQTAIGDAVLVSTPSAYACSCLAVVSPRAQAPPPTRTMLMRGE